MLGNLSVSIVGRIDYAPPPREKGVPTMYSASSPFPLGQGFSRKSLWNFIFWGLYKSINFIIRKLTSNAAPSYGQRNEKILLPKAEFIFLSSANTIPHILKFVIFD